MTRSGADRGPSESSCAPDLPIPERIEIVNVALTADDLEDLREALVGEGEIDDPDACDGILAAFDAAVEDAECLGDEAA